MKWNLTCFLHDGDGSLEKRENNKNDKKLKLKKLIFFWKNLASAWRDETQVRYECSVTRFGHFSTFQKSLVFLEVLLDLGKLVKPFLCYQMDKCLQVAKSLAVLGLKVKPFQHWDILFTTAPTSHLNNALWEVC